MPENRPAQPDDLQPAEAYVSHPRHFQGSQLVYPVLSRRSHGISVGINLCPRRQCNFNCVYCQVSRPPGQAPPPPELASLETLESELRETLDLAVSGRLYGFTPFDQTPPALRRLNDIALSGDGEPTAAENFADACRVVARVKKQSNLDRVKIVLITNSSLLHRPAVQEALAVLDAHHGEIWAKLDAGTESYFRLINQTDVPYGRILKNILQTAQVRPIVIQTLLVKLRGRAMPPDEVAAYADQLRRIASRGGRIARIQLYTIARPPRLTQVAPLSKAEIDDIARRVGAAVDIPIETFHAAPED